MVFTSTSFFSNAPIVTRPLPNVPIHGVPSESSKSHSISDSPSRSSPYFSLYMFFSSSSFFSSASMVAGPVPDVHIHGMPSESSKSHSISDSLSTSSPYFSLYNVFTSSSFCSSTSIVAAPVPTVHIQGVPSSSTKSPSLLDSLSTSWPNFSLYNVFTSSSFSCSTFIVAGPVPTVQIHGVPSSSIKSVSISDSLSTSWPYFSRYIFLISSSFSSNTPIVTGPLLRVHGVLSC
mmetsp:Transcript_18351/g.34625  ORF Transcript_18351/g.34625 Transcript_18351/m.34625 type:complete len:233 (-) Transcript_18351:519-1217(-)